jgi:hypothetical protein
MMAAAYNLLAMPRPGTPDIIAYAKLLLLLDIVIHGFAQNPTLVQEPHLLSSVDLPARLEHVI